MSAERYLLGAALLAAMLAPIAYGAARVRARALPGWMGAPARLAEAVIGLALVIAVLQLVGIVGLFGVVPVLLGCAAAGLAAAAWSRRGAADEAGERPPSPPVGPLGAVVAATACAVVATGWAERVDFSIHAGMYDPDTLWFHLPYAARFAQEGTIAPLHFTSFEPLTTFYPGTTNLLHALGILAFDRDVLSPLVNLGWLALALLAGWCVGRPFGAAPATLTGTALVAGAPIMIGMQAGSAKDDVAGLALLLAAAALLLNARGRNAAIALAALATGLVLSVKLSVILPALALALGGVLVARRGERRRAAAMWGAALVAGGGFWYLRNLFAIGNPVPWVGIDLGPVSLPRPELLPFSERYVKLSIADYVDDGGFWGTWFEPALDQAFGPGWWAIFGLAVLGAVLAIGRGPTPVVRMLGGVALASAVAYAVTPATAGGSPEGVPHLVLWSLRYLTPALALGLALLPLAPWLAGRRGWIPLGAFAVLLAVTQAADGPFQLWADFPSLRVSAAGAVVVAGAALAAAVARSRPSRRVLAAGGAALAVAVLAVGWRVQDIYLDKRYTDPAAPLAGAYSWARQVRDERIAIAGSYLQYPLYGEDLSNRVQYLGDPGPDGAFEPITSCRDWRRALNDGGYRYVVTAPFNFPWTVSPGEPPEARWTRTDRAATEIASDGSHVSIFRVDDRLDPAACRPGDVVPVPSRTTGRTD
jgi:hypothetical protein